MIMTKEMIRIKKIIEKEGYYIASLLDTNQTRNAVKRMLKRNIIIVSQKDRSSIKLIKNWI